MPEELYKIHKNTPSISVAGWFQGAVAGFGDGKLMGELLAQREKNADEYKEFFLKKNLSGFTVISG